MTESKPLFDRLIWRDPLSGKTLEPLVTTRTPAGVPLCGALRIPGTSFAYPIVDCVARLTPNLAKRYEAWLAPLDLQAPPHDGGDAGFQDEGTVDSFGFQWTWNASMRTEEDLRWRVAERFHIPTSAFSGKVFLDAGAGAGDQSAWMLSKGAQVVSVDLSSAIEVVARKSRLNRGWFGVQGDITALPFTEGQFEGVYCEGVIQHTRDSALTVKELCRVLSPGGLILATHYGRSKRFLGRLRVGFINALRGRLHRVERYKLLWLTGNLAALAYIPVIGRLVRMSGLALHYDLMPDFKSTWTNTFDNFGNHAYQRYITEEEFWSYFERAGGIGRIHADGTVVAGRKQG